MLSFVQIVCATTVLINGRQAVFRFVITLCAGTLIYQLLTLESSLELECGHVLDMYN